MSIATHNAIDAMTTPQVAAAAGVPLWQLQSCIRRRIITPPPKLGPQFLWTAEDLGRVRRGLIAAGYLPPADAPDPKEPIP